MKKYRGKYSNVWVNVGAKGKQKLFDINVNRERTGSNKKVTNKKKTNAEFNQMLSKSNRKNTNSKSYQSMKAQARQKQIAHDYPMKEDQDIKKQIYKVPRTLDITVLLLIFMVFTFSNISFNRSLLRNDDHTPINIESNNMKYYDKDIKVHGVNDFIYNNTLYDRISKIDTISDPILSNGKYYYDLNYIHLVGSKLSLNGKDYLVKNIDSNSNIQFINGIDPYTYGITLPNGVYDSVDNKRLGRWVAQNTDNWNVNTRRTNTVYAYLSINLPTNMVLSNMTNGGNMIGNILTHAPMAATDVEGFYAYTANIYVSILWSKLGVNSSNTNQEIGWAIRDYLVANNFTVYYQLATPITTGFKTHIMSNQPLEQINLYKQNNIVNEYVAYDTRYIDTFNDLAKKDGWKIVNGFKTVLNTLSSIGSIGNWALEKTGFAPIVDTQELNVVGNRVLITLDYNKDYNHFLNDFDFLPAQPYKDYENHIYEIKVLADGLKKIDPYYLYRHYKWVNNDWELIESYNNNKTWEKTAHPIPVGYVDFTPNFFYSLYGKTPDFIVSLVYGWERNIIVRPYIPPV